MDNFKKIDFSKLNKDQAMEKIKDYIELEIEKDGHCAGGRKKDVLLKILEMTNQGINNSK